MAKLRILRPRRSAAALALVALVAAPAFAEDNFGIPLHGFADVNWGRSGDAMPQREATNGFGLGTLDLYLVPQFSNNVRSLLEIALESSLGTQAVGIDVERLQVGYTFNDAITLWSGRFHTPYGYWNTAYHHGAQLQPSIYKPRFLDWEDHTGILPAHTTGAWASGRFDAGPGRLEYDAYLANGSRNLAGYLDMNILRDDNNGVATGGRLTYVFSGGLDGLMVGAHGLTEEVDTYDSADPTAGNRVARAQLRIVGGYAAYEAHGFEASAEYYGFFNSDLNDTASSVRTSSAGFVHVGYAVMKDWVPYARVERARFDQLDPYFNTQVNGLSYDRGVVGVRYNTSNRSCAKLEFSHTSIRDTNSIAVALAGTYSTVNAGDYNEVRAQYAISF